MTVGRDNAAAKTYRDADKTARRDMIRYAQCDTGRDAGLLRGYMARDFEALAETRRKAATTRGQRMERKSQFFALLARMAVRNDRLKELNA